MKSPLIRWSVHSCLSSLILQGRIYLNVVASVSLHEMCHLVIKINSRKHENGHLIFGVNLMFILDFFCRFCKWRFARINTISLMSIDLFTHEFALLKNNILRRGPTTMCYVLGPYRCKFWKLINFLIFFSSIWNYGLTVKDLAWWQHFSFSWEMWV